ncbi:MAG: GTPase ObgE [Bacteroidales bacterium]|nr:GTPase ObgE [Bacteroidales bacterium]
MPDSNFVDYIRIFCRSGKGGAGSAHLHRAKYIPKGGPDGGDGGRGGHIFIEANRNLWTLIHLRFKKHINAGNGQPGSSAMKTGADGGDIIIEVPPGTIVKDEETNEVLAEVTQHGEKKILLPGGRGGLGNTHFKSPTNQTPRYAQPGEEGREAFMYFELKVLADIGLVGFPNAGKSTLLSVLSAAKPKIADYAFTTLEPSVGIVSYRDDRSFVVADIPGIIEGASEGKGLGLRFLRHIERNAALLFLVPADSHDINQEYRILLRELEKYNPELLDKKRVLAVTKSDLLDEELMLEIVPDLPDIPRIFISSVAQYNLEKLKDLLWSQLTLTE